MSTSLQSAQAARLEELASEEKRLAALIEERTKRVMALSEQADTLRKDAAKLFRERFSSRFRDLDVVAALAGHPVGHVARLFGVGYELRPPSQTVVHSVEVFTSSPPSGLGPVSANEAILLAWLAVVHVENAPSKDLTVLPLADRLAAIRRLPELLVLKLSEECSSIQTYLNVCLEQELGNF